MKSFDSLRGALLMGALLCLVGLTEPVRAADAATAAGVLGVAPQREELGAGWGERTVVYVIDPRESPAEFVNERAGRNPTNRAAIVRIIRGALQRNGSVGMAEIWYGYSGGILELTLSRFPDRKALENHWKELSAKSDTKTAAPKVGESAEWLGVAAGASGRTFVFRQGLFIGLLDCGEKLSGEPLKQLAKATAGKMVKAGEPSAAPTVIPRQQ